MQRMAWITLGAAALLGMAVPARADAVWERSNLFGDLGGLRPKLDELGMTLSLQTTNEVFGNLSGGLHTGSTFDGVALAALSLDTEKAWGWAGGTVYVSVYGIYGHGPTPTLVGGFDNVSNIEANTTWRLTDAYFDQAWGIADLRVGQFGVDEEFMNSQFTATGGTAAGDFANANALFVNSSFGFPSLPSADLPGGGPAYPLPAPGVRLKLQATGRLGLMFAAFSGDPGGPGVGDPQGRNLYGVLFPVCCGVLGFAEAQYAIDQDKDSPGLPGTYRIGMWYRTGAVIDLRFRRRRGSQPVQSTLTLAPYQAFDYSIYVNADQMIWQTGDAKSQGIGVFARVMAAPDYRDIISAYANAGLTWKGVLPGRPANSLGIGVAYSRISPRAVRLDQDYQALTQSGATVGNHEALLEVTYQMQAAPWWTVQPDLQYILQPGGGRDSFDPSRRVSTALVIGLRSMITF